MLSQTFKRRHWDLSFSPAQFTTDSTTQAQPVTPDFRPPPAHPGPAGAGVDCYAKLSIPQHIANLKQGQDRLSALSGVDTSVPQASKTR